MLLFLLLLFILCVPAKGLAGELHVDAKAALLMDADTGQVYYAKNADQTRSPASLTKIMTAIIALENGHLDDVVEISARAGSVGVGSTLGINKGDHITLSNLLKAALIISANDATVAIGEHVGGQHDNFIRQMNKKALLLGALNTKFINTNGYYDPQHYTTAYDLGLITRYALQKPILNQLVATREEVVEWVEPSKTRAVRNTNRLLHNDALQGIDGVKTGSTPRAGDCLIASATRGDLRLIAVVLNAGNRYTEAAKLLEYGFAEIKDVTIFPSGKPLEKIRVEQGNADAVPVAFAKPVRVKITQEQQKKLKLESVLPEQVNAPVQQGQTLGQAVFTVDGYELVQAALVATQEVEPAGFWAGLWYRCWN